MRGLELFSARPGGTGSTYGAHTYRHRKVSFEGEVRAMPEEYIP
jgi:hypothetical protein